MADTKVGVEFYAKTDAAIDAVRGLSAATREQLEAAEAAGKGQKGLGREVAQTRALQVQATEAARHARQAQQDLALTIQAFGKDSAEAAAALAKLSAAEAEARRAGAAAADSLAKTAKNVEAATRSTDGLTPATKRAAAQVAKMGVDAERTAADLRRLELQQIAAARAAEKQGGGFDVAALASSKLMAVLGPAALVGTLTGVAGWLGTAAEKTLQYQTALANLPFTLEGAQRATRGLVNEQTLMSAASSAVALKVATTAEDFEALAEASTKLAAKLSQPADQLLNNLVTALGRGSTELLDNAGIVLKTAEAQSRYAASIGKTTAELTAQEKATAFRIEALKAIKESADGTAVAFDSGAAAVVRWKVRFIDAMAAAERAPIAVADAVVGSAREVERWNGYLQQTEEMLRVLQDPVGSLEQRMLALSDATRGANQVGLEWLSTLIMSEEQLRKVEDAKYTARAGALQEEADKARAEQVLKARRERAAADAAAFSRDRAAREEFAKMQAGAEKAGAKAASKGESAAKRKAAFAMDLSDWDAEVATYAAKEAQRLRAEDVEHQEQMFQRAEALHEKRLAVFDHEGAMLEMQLAQQLAAGLAEEEAQAQREALLDRRYEAEQEMAERLTQLAKTEEQREAARTRIQVTAQERQLAARRLRVDGERAAYEKQAAGLERVMGRISSVGDAMADAAWEAAEGQKGAGLMALGEYLKTVSKQMAVKALVETALGISALAGVVTAGLAPGHFAAAGAAAGAALAAGAGAVGLTKAGEARAAEGKGADAPEVPTGGVTASGSSPAPTGASSGAPREMTVQDVPVSYAERGAPANGPIIHIDLSGGTWIGAGGPEKAAQEILSVLDTGRAAGRR